MNSTLHAPGRHACTYWHVRVLQLEEPITHISIAQQTQNRSSNLLSSLNKQSHSSNTSGGEKEESIKEQTHQPCLSSQNVFPSLSPINGLLLKGYIHYLCFRGVLLMWQDQRARQIQCYCIHVKLSGNSQHGQLRQWLLCGWEAVCHRTVPTVPCDHDRLQVTQPTTCCGTAKVSTYSPGKKNSCESSSVSHRKAQYCGRSCCLSCNNGREGAESLWDWNKLNLLY